MADESPHTLVMGPPHLGLGSLHRPIDRLPSDSAVPLSPRLGPRRSPHPSGDQAAGTPIHFVPRPFRSRFRALWSCRRGAMGDRNPLPTPARSVGHLWTGGENRVRAGYRHHTFRSAGTGALPAGALGSSDGICRRPSRWATDALESNTPAFTLHPRLAKHISSSCIAPVIAPHTSRRLALAFLAASGHSHRFSDPISRPFTSTQLP